jgi:hypothetical protein
MLEERAVLRALHEYAHSKEYGVDSWWVPTLEHEAVFNVFRAVEGDTIHREDGAADLADYIANYPKPPSFRKHVIVDPIIDIDGHQATVRAYWLLFQRDDATGRPVLGAFGHYQDRFGKVDGRWVIVDRQASVEAM